MVLVFELGEKRMFFATGDENVTGIYLRTQCDQPATEVACTLLEDSGSSYLRRELEPGIYYLFVETVGPGTFQFMADIECEKGQLFDPAQGKCIKNPCQPNPCTREHKTLSTPVLPDQFICQCDPGTMASGDTCVINANATGESCADPVAILGTEGEISVNVTGASNDAASFYCGGDRGADRVYAFSLMERARVSFKVKEPELASKAVLYLRSFCDDDLTERGCSDGEIVQELSVKLEPGVYFLWADVQGGEALNGYTLVYGMQLDPCHADPCPSGQICVPLSDYTSYECICPAGTILQDGNCVDDPCDPRARK